MPSLGAISLPAGYTLVEGLSASLNPGQQHPASAKGAGVFFASGAHGDMRNVSFRSQN